MTRSKATSSPTKKDAAQKNAAKKNSPDGRDQKTTGELKPEGGGNSFPPTQPAATAASPQPPVDPSSKDPFQPIAKLEDPHDDTKNETAATSQDAALTTPNHDTQLQSEEGEQHTPEVTFHLPRASSVSISRRQRSRTAKAGGRTSRALSQDGQRMFLWRRNSTNAYSIVRDQEQTLSPKSASRWPVANASSLASRWLRTSSIAT